MSVLLGLCDAEVGGNGYIDWSTTKVGGLPDWMTSSAEWPKCRLCQQPCAFIVQIYCPIGGSQFHRTLYIFACRNKACWNKPESWFVFRSQLLEETETSAESQAKTEESIDWGCDADDWAVDDWGEGSEEKDLTAQLDQMALSPEDTYSKNGIVDSSLIKKSSEPSAELATASVVQSITPEILDNLIVARYVAVIEETIEKENSPYDHESRLMKEYAKHEGIDLKSLLECDSMDTGGGQEKYEKSHVPHGDAIFQKFKKRIQQCPQQILRYEYGGHPLNMKKPLVDVIPPCENCGQPRIYEVQLMPALISHLRFANKSDEVVEFGTVQIYTCKGSCWNDGSVRSEYILVQDDPDQHLFR